MTAPGEENDYLSARPGDHLFCPFECDGCAFFHLKWRLPDPKSRVDSLLQVFIRRANLDAFWSRRPGTVEGMRRLFFAQAEVGDFFGFEMFDRIGPFPHDYFPLAEPTPRTTRGKAKIFIHSEGAESSYQPS
jgi:hypothetical protein